MGDYFVETVLDQLLTSPTNSTNHSQQSKYQQFPSSSSLPITTSGSPIINNGNINPISQYSSSTMMSAPIMNHHGTRSKLPFSPSQNPFMLARSKNLTSPQLQVSPQDKVSSPLLSTTSSSLSTSPSSSSSSSMLNTTKQTIPVTSSKLPYKQATNSLNQKLIRILYVNSEIKSQSPKEIAARLRHIAYSSTKITNYSFDCVKDGFEAIELLSKNRYTSIIIFNDLPNLSGIETIQIIKNMFYDSHSHHTSLYNHNNSSNISGNSTNDNKKNNHPLCPKIYLIGKPNHYQNEFDEKTENNGSVLEEDEEIITKVYRNDSEEVFKGIDFFNLMSSMVADAQ